MNFILSAFTDEAASSLDGQISACHENGISYIELRGINGRNVSDLSFAEAKEIANRLNAEGIRLSAVGSPLGKIGIRDDFAPHLEKFKHTAQLANIFSTRNIRLFSFFIPQNQLADLFKEEVLERLGHFVQAADDAGVRCCHENEKDIYGDTPERCLTIFEAFGGKIGGIFDFANFIQCGEDPQRAYHLLKDTIDYYHIKDALANGSIVPAGEGVGHINDILKNAAQKEGSCFLTIEPHLTVFDGFDQLEKNGASMKKPYTFGTSKEAFAAAVAATKKIVSRLT